MAEANRISSMSTLCWVRSGSRSRSTNWPSVFPPCFPDSPIDKVEGADLEDFDGLLKAKRIDQSG